jgi:hypothetical protein
MTGSGQEGIRSRRKSGGRSPSPAPVTGVVRFEFDDPTSLGLNDVCIRFNQLEQLWSTAIELARWAEDGPPEDWAPLNPSHPRNRSSGVVRVQRVSYGSPMLVEVATHGSGLGAGIGAGAYAAYLVMKALKNPAAIGGWLPQLVAGWHRANAEALEAKGDHDQARRSYRAAERRAEGTELFSEAAERTERDRLSRVEAVGLPPAPSELLN